MSTLVAHDLRVTPPGTREPVLRDITLTVAPGDWLAMRGPNGSGKSSLLLTLAGLWPASGGRLELDEAPFGPERRESAAGKVAVVLQDPSSQLLQPTVADELAFTSRNLGWSERQTAEAVARWSTRFGLSSELDRDPNTLSAGRQQLVLLAAALVPGPQLLLADEPTAHMDSSTRALVREVIGDWIEHGASAVWATQDEAEIAAATRTLELGSKVALGRREGADRPQPARPALTIRVTTDAPAVGPRVQMEVPIEIEVHSAGITALLGPNGVGKTLVLSVVAGVSTSSQVVVEWKYERPVASILAFQFPELQIFEEKVADEIVFAAVSRGVPRSEALDTARTSLQRLGMDAEAILDRETWSLSAGEKRLIEVVGALIAPSSLVLLDEPTAGLDPDRSFALGDLVLERSGSVGVLVASQDRVWVEALATRSYTLGGG